MCDGIGLKINVGRIKAFVDRKDQKESFEKVKVSGEEMEAMGKFKYLGLVISGRKE